MLKIHKTGENKDFCVWGPPKSDGLPAGRSNTTIGQVEKDVVAYCTKCVQFFFLEEKFVYCAYIVLCFLTDPDMEHDLSLMEQSRMFSIKSKARFMLFMYISTEEPTGSSQRTMCKLQGQDVFIISVLSLVILGASSMHMVQMGKEILSVGGKQETQ